MKPSNLRTPRTIGESTWYPEAAAISHTNHSYAARTARVGRKVYKTQISSGVAIANAKSVAPKLGFFKRGLVSLLIKLLSFLTRTK